MIGIGTALSVGQYIWHNRRGIMRGYHHFVKHRVLLDDLIDLADDHPESPVRKEKEKKTGE